MSDIELYRKIPWRLSKFQKARQRKRLRAVDTVISVVDKALTKQGITTKAVERWKAEMPVEQEMVPRDKYTMFDRKEKKYRKGIHSQCTNMSNAYPNLNILTHCRTTKVDKSFSKSQSPRLLIRIWLEIGDNVQCTISVLS
jgi:hypothetical protein